MMRKIQSAIIVAAGVLMLCAAGACQSASQGYSHAELKKMIGEAHTAEQYRALATYFRSQQKTYKLKAADEMDLWVRRNEIMAGLYEKYPRPSDSSRNRYEYFSYESRQMNAQASHYEELAANAPQ
jgi:hypothetical protein